MMAPLVVGAGRGVVGGGPGSGVARGRQAGAACRGRGGCRGDLPEDRMGGAEGLAGNDGDDAATGVIGAGITEGRGLLDEVDDVAVNSTHEGRVGNGSVVQRSQIDAGWIIIAVVLDVEGPAAVAR